MRILLTGKKGQLVRHFKDYVRIKYPEFEVDLLSLKNEQWIHQDFSKYDVIIHCAGLVGHKNCPYDDYKKINVALTKEVFLKAIEAKVEKFVYLSSMAVYDGTDWGFGEDGIIKEETTANAKSFYGKSKYEAEKVIENFKTDSIKTMIVRAPVIIGEGMEDYFGKYIKFSRYPLPIPLIHREAKRSFVYVDTLVTFICYLILNNKEGIFFPQNLPLLSVSEIYEEVCSATNRKRKKINISEKLLPTFVEKKLFRQISYAPELSVKENSVCGEISSREAIQLTIGGGKNEQK